MVVMVTRVARIVMVAEAAVAHAAVAITPAAAVAEAGARLAAVVVIVVVAVVVVVVVRSTPAQLCPNSGTHFCLTSSAQMPWNAESRRSAFRGILLCSYVRCWRPCKG